MVSRLARRRAADARGETQRRQVSGRNLLYFLSMLMVCLGTTGGLVGFRIADPFVVQQARQIAFDLLQRASPRAYRDDVPIKIVDIDERSLSTLGQWPWPRDVLAELVDRLHAAGAVAVSFDFLFVEPDRMSLGRAAADSGAGGADPARPPSNDELFADAIRRGNVVLGFGTSAARTEMPPVKAGFAFTGKDPSSDVTRLRGGASVLPVLAEAAAGIGSVNLRSDDSGDGVRVVQLVWSDGKKLFPSLITESLRIAQGASTYVVNVDPEIGGVQSLRIGAFDVPTGPRGEFFLYYTKPHAERYVSAADIFDNERLTALVPDLSGKMVLIGTSAAGLFDLHRTALGDVVPGIEMHAQALEQIIDGQFLLRKDWTGSVELFALVITCLTVGLTTIFGGAWIALIGGMSFSAVIVVGAWYSFRELGVLVDFSFPLGGGIATWFVATAFRYLVTDREKRGMRHAFSHYVHPTVLKQIEQNHSEVRLGGENCELTVMFTDVRNFTPLSERLAPEELVAFLNTLLGALSDEIAQTGGVIDKFIGDSVMAFWNAPLRQADHARRACLAALAMRKAIDAMTARGGFGLPDHVARDTTIEIGVGINTGPACVGNVGSAERFNYSAIGDAVNVAARAESACKELGFDLVVCKSTADLAPDLAFLDAGGVPLKGKSAPVPMMILVGDAATRASAEFAAFARHYDDLIRALRARDPAALAHHLAQCRQMAGAVEPRLAGFLDRLPARRTDFDPGHADQSDLVAAK